MHQQYRRVLSLVTIGLIFAAGVASGSSLEVDSTYAAPSAEYQVFRAKLRDYLQKKSEQRAPVTTTAPREWFGQDTSVSPAIVQSLTVPAVAPAVRTPQNVERVPSRDTRTIPSVSTSTAPLQRGIPLLEEQIEEVQFEDLAGTLTPSEKEAWKTFYATLFAKFPDGFIDPMRFFRLRHGGEGSRGLAGSNIMIVRISDVTKPEAASVAVHELGHIVDLGYLKGTGYAAPSVFKDGSQNVPSDDPSVQFYSISWKNAKERKSQTTAADFVSGYAMTDPFEDFAESFIMYVNHGEYFAAMAESNSALAKKYAFLRDTVFDGKEFRGISKVPTARVGSARTWDATLLDYDFVTFWSRSFE